MNPLRDKIALVTGASRGIGKAIALKLSELGASVIVHYGNNEIEAQKTVDAITHNKGKAFSVKADLTTFSAIDTLSDNIKKILGSSKLDILTHNAGILSRQSILDISEKQFDDMFMVNVKAPFFLTAKLLPFMNDGGRIINISSQVSRRPRFESGAYAMTKAALDNFTQSLASKVGERNITVNSILPGMTNTLMNQEKLSNANTWALIERKIALKRIGEPIDIANVVALLVSKEGDWITGQCIEASGGTGLIHTS